MTYVVWANQRIHRPHAGGRKPAGVRPVIAGGVNQKWGDLRQAG